MGKLACRMIIRVAILALMFMILPVVPQATFPGKLPTGLLPYGAIESRWLEI